MSFTQPCFIRNTAELRKKMEELNYKIGGIMNKTVLQAIIDHIFGHKYYANIINTRGTAKCELTSFIHHSKDEAERHRHEIESTVSYLHVETVSFRSRKTY